MARDPPLVNSPPTIASGKVHIGHVQLRDLIICPREQGVVNYVHNTSIVEHDLRNPSVAPRCIADTTFGANTITSLPLEDSGNYLLAAGGQDAQIHLSLQRADKTSTVLADDSLPGSINNSILLTSLNLARSNQSSVEPRIGISNNDCTFRFYDIALRSRDISPTPRLKIFSSVGSLKLDVPINHSSISPDGRTLLSAGDSNKVHLHHLSGSSRITFTPINSLSLPPCPSIASFSDYSSLTASFSTAFSANGSKFAVASQEGIVVVWDVRSSKPLKTFTTDRDRRPSGGRTSGVQEASGWLSDDPWEWTRGNSRAPGWSVRSLKFAKDNGGKEIMAFTEHTSMVHVVDAQTFESHNILRMPSIPRARSASPQSHSHPQPNPNSTLLARARARHRPYQLRTSLSPPAPSSFSPSQSPLFAFRSNILHSTQPSQRMIQALEDTFRISPRLHRELSQRGLDNVEEEGNYMNAHHQGGEGEEGAFEVDPSEDVLVIPPLGEADQADVRAIFGGHGIRIRQARTLDEFQGSAGDNSMGAESSIVVMGGGGDNNTSDSEMLQAGMMEADELESDYCASHTPSRSPSPSPPSNIPVPSRISSVGASRRGVGRGSTMQRDGPGDVDLAGVCFDPHGRWLYVASVDGVAEWQVSGREKRWWSDCNDGWA